MTQRTMENTVESSAILFSMAQRLADFDGVPVRDILESALRRSQKASLEDDPQEEASSPEGGEKRRTDCQHGGAPLYEMRDCSVPGGYLTEEFRDAPWSMIRAAAYDRSAM